MDDFSDENAEPDIYEEDDNAGEDDVGVTEDPDQMEPEHRNNIVVSGDPAAAAKAADKNTVKSMRDKKVPNDKRTTTPYMTKYERARVLGTRALQIRLVGHSSEDILQ
jgi:DNA-directed RNA polymerase I, II, and III subunit RPABC2